MSSSLKKEFDVINRVCLLFFAVSCRAAVSCLREPSFLSPWVIMDTYVDNTLTRTFQHDFGTHPIKADVQVMSMTTGYIYPGVNTAQADNEHGVRAGVVCKFDAFSVTLYAPNTLYGTSAFLIYTGENYWTEAGREMATSALVRVRLWHPDDFPTPSFSHSFIATSGETNGNRWNISHGGSQLPDFAIVRGMAVDDYLFEAVGSNAQPIWATHAHWGAIVYGVDAEYVFIWAPVNGEGSLFSVCGGWGQLEESNCKYDVATIEVLVWSSLEATLVFQKEFDITLGNTFLQAPTLFNITTDLIFVGAKSGGPYSGVLFPGVGAAMSNDGGGDAGLVYGYSNTGDTMSVWFSAIRIGPGMAYFLAEPDYIKITNAVAEFKVWRGDRHIHSTVHQWRILTTSYYPTSSMNQGPTLESTPTLNQGRETTFNQGRDTTLNQGRETTLYHGLETTFNQGRESTLYQGRESTFNQGRETTLFQGPETTFNQGRETTLYQGPETTSNQGRETTLYQGPETTFNQGRETTLYQGPETTLYQGPETTLNQGRETTLYQGTISTSYIYPTSTTYKWTRTHIYPTPTTHIHPTSTTHHWTALTTYQNPTSTIDQETTSRVHPGQTSSLHQGTTFTVQQGTTSRAHPGSTSSLHQGTTFTVQQGTTSRVHHGSTSSLHQGTTFTVQQGTASRVHQGSTTSIYQGTSSTVQQGATSTVHRWPTSSLHQGTPTTVQQGTTPTIHLGSTSSIYQGTSSTVQQGTTPTVHHVTPSTVYPSTSLTAHQGTASTTHIYPPSTLTVHPSTTSFQTTTLEEPIQSTASQEITPTTILVSQMDQLQNTNNSFRGNTTAYPVVCFQQISINITDAQLIGEQIAQNLTVPAKTTSKYIRKLTSAPDKRSSSQAIGMIGVAVCSSLALLIAIPDLVNLFRYLCQLFPH